MNIKMNMNMITVLIVALVLCAYYYPSAPKMLKDNKQMLLGVFVGLLMGQFLGMNVEGGPDDDIGLIGFEKGDIIRPDCFLNGVLWDRESCDE